MRLFISYAQVNKTIVKKWIVDNLIAGGHDIWFDERLIAGQDLKNQLSTEIQHRDALIFCMTPEAVQSTWCKWELATADQYHIRIIPVLLQAKTEIPPSLKGIKYVDFTTGEIGDAVARLMAAIQTTNKPQKDRTFWLALAIISVLIVTISIFLINNSANSASQPTETSQHTASTPIIVALQDIDIRNAPDADASTIGILSVGNSLDILGISEDRIWYQVLLPNGRQGWVLAISTLARLEGNRGILPVIIPTFTPSHSPTNTHTPTETATFTNTPTPTELLTSTATHTSTSTNTNIPSSTSSNTPTLTATSTPQPTLTHTLPPTAHSVSTATAHFVNGQYPCLGRVISSSTSNQLNIIYARASNNQPPIASIQNGTTITIREDTLLTGRKWYRIEYTTQGATGWVWDTYIEPEITCP